MQIDQQIEAMKEEIITALQECIRIKSVKDSDHTAQGAPFGPGIQKGLEWILALGEKFGFTVKNVEGYAGHIEMGSTKPSAAKDELIGILGHIDVVPEGEGWSVPPYSGAIKDGKIFGRGALDDKGPSIAALFAMKAIKDAHIPLNKRVRLIIGTDEESGWADMDYYLKKEEVPQIGFAPDAEFPVIHAEKGILHLEFNKSPVIPFPHMLSIQGGERANIVPDTCNLVLAGISRDIIETKLGKYPFPQGVNGELISPLNDQKVMVMIKGVGAHGSLPQNGKNAIIYALQFLRTLPLSKDEQQTVDFMLEHPGNGYYGEGFDIAFSDEPSGKLSLNLGVFELASDKIRFVLDIRYPVTTKSAEITAQIEKIALAEEFSLKVLTHQEAHYVPKDSPLVQSLLKAYTDVTGLEPFAFAIGGGTYAKVLPQGVAFGPVFPGEPEVIHCADEYILIKNLLLTTKIYAQAILNLAAQQI